jgi:hypothetical protein
MIKINTLLNIFSCFFLCGLIWTIQLVHYPAFSFAKENFQTFHAFHSFRISLIVLPIMCIELLSGILLFVYGGHSQFWLYNLVLIFGVWLSTFFLSVPQHNVLGIQFNEHALFLLVLTNWVRTFLWTFRSGLLLLFLFPKI